MQRDVWEAIAKSWSERRQKPPQEVIEFSENKNFLLDIGCGSGRNFLKGKKYIGIDFSREMLLLAKQNAKKKGSKTHLILADMSALPLKNGIFGDVLFVAVLHVSKKRKHALSELKRVMKRNGRALVTVWNKDQKRFAKAGKAVHVPWKVGNKRHLRYYYMFKEDEFRKLLGAYFEVERIESGKITGDRRNITAIVKKI